MWVVSAVWVVAILVLLLMAWRHRRRRTHLGPGAIGTIEDLLNEERRNAMELIVEEKAEERRPEYPDGNLPDLEEPDP